MSYPHKTFTSNIIELKSEQLPAACPISDKDVLYQHPRVYLQFENGKAVCPYCGALYAYSSSADELLT